MANYPIVERPSGSIKHYYGDTVRLFFGGIAAVILLCLPFSGVMQLSVFVGIPVIAILVLLAGLTHPHGRFIMIADVIASIGGLLMAEVIALAAYRAEAWVPLAILEFIGLLFLAASYFSLKTMRAMMMHKIGHIETGNDFADSETGTT